MLQTSRSLPRGPIADLATPFARDQRDEAALAHLVDLQVSAGMAGLLVCGPTGEPWSLDDEERTKTINDCVRAARSRLPVIVGTGTNDTERTIALTGAARSLGAVAAYIVMPYYSKPSQEGVVRHYQAICSAVDLPVIVGIAPQRTAVDLAPRTLERLAGIDGIVAIDDATGDIGRLVTTPLSLRRRVAFYAGHEPTAVAFRFAGGKGAISAAANLVPEQIVAVHRAVDRGDAVAALALAEKLWPLFQALERECVAPAIKYGLNLLHGIAADVRLPMTPVSAETAAVIRTALDGLESSEGEPADQAARPQHFRRHTFR